MMVWKKDFDALLKDGDLSAYKIIHSFAKLLGERLRRTEDGLPDIGARSGQAPDPNAAVADQSLSSKLLGYDGTTGASGEVEKRAPCVRADLKSDKRCGLLCCLVSLASNFNLCPACAEVEGLPAQQSPASAVPCTARRVSGKHRAGHTWNAHLGKQKS